MTLPYSICNYMCACVCSTKEKKLSLQQKMKDFGLTKAFWISSEMWEFTILLFA